MRIVDKWKGRQWRMGDVEQNAELNNLLNFLDRLADLEGGSYYVLDYVHQEVYLTQSALWLLSGRKKIDVGLNRFDFFQEMFRFKDHHKWETMRNSANKFLKSHAIERQINLVLEYGILLKSSESKNYYMRQRIIPVFFTQTPNVYHAICKIYATDSSLFDIAEIFDRATGERFVYDPATAQFKALATLDLILEEKTLLKAYACGLSKVQIARSLGYSETTLHRKEKIIQQKLNVASLPQAMYQAVKLGLI
ncbi:hypothetical protein FACS1894201_08710 [Bacteroidia bacterium]|nr:hypothetical protein FACS1894201_08710 [Bacteroidia bacterium]